MTRKNTILELGAILDSKLSFSNHIQLKINKAFSMLGLLKRNFKYIGIASFTVLYKCMVRSHLEYCNSVWAPYKKSDFEDLEKVQKRATKIIPNLAKLSYSERLRACKLFTLVFRRIRGDMIETYKIVSGKYDNLVALKLETSDLGTTKGNKLKLANARTRYDLRKYFFTNRIINIWKSLPNHVVGACTTNQFKNRLDKFWEHQDIVYDYKSHLTGVRSRSVIDTLCE